MAPAEDARHVVERLAVAFGPRARKFLRREEERDRAVGDLRAIADFDAAADDLVEFAFVLRVTLAHEPVASLRVRIALRVGVIHRRNVREVFILEAVALVVLVAEPAEQFRKRELDSLGFALVPRRGAEDVAADGRIDGLHLLDADHAREVVARRPRYRPTPRGSRSSPTRMRLHDGWSAARRRRDRSRGKMRRYGPGWAYSSAAKLPTCAVSTSCGSILSASSAPKVASRIAATKCFPSFDQLRAKSVCAPPNTYTGAGFVIARSYRSPN